MEYTNTVYKDIQEYIKHNHGWLMDDFLNSPIGKRYIDEMNTLRQFNGKRVTISFTQDRGIIRQNGQKYGKIIIDNNRIKFYEGKNRTHYQRLDCGMYDGFYATLIPLSIKEV